MGHPLVRLADRIDWEGLEQEVAGCFAEAGRPETPARFALDMLMLNAMHDLSDEALWARWPCDPYFQYFTGGLYFQHKVPHERLGLCHWRGRLGSEVLDGLIREHLRVAHTTGRRQGRATPPRYHRDRHRPHDGRPPHAPQPPQGPTRRPLQRQDSRRRLQPAPAPAMAGKLCPMPHRCMVRSPLTQPKTGAFLTDYNPS